MGLSRKNNCNTPVEDINGKFQGVEQKSLEFQGVDQKLRKNMDFQGGQCKNMENSRGLR